MTEHNAKHKSIGTRMDTNSQRKKYACSYCGKSFSRSEHKARHERSHTGVKPFECKVCGHEFVRRDLLQRHIRTVHRELLLVESSMESGAGRSKDHVKSDVLLELLVNSMIKVNGDERGDDKCRSLVYVSDKSVGRRKTKRKGPVRESVEFRPLSEELVGKVCGLVKDLVDAGTVRQLHARGVEDLVERNVFVHSVRESSSPADPPPLLVATIVCIGAYLDSSEEVASGLWHLCWSRCLQESSLVAMNLLVHALLLFSRHQHTEAGIRHVFISYQQVLVEHIQKESDTFSRDETWLIFHIWVSLLRSLNGSNHQSTLIYEWFLRQPVLDDSNLKEVISQVVLNNNKWHLTTLNLVADVLYCDWIIGGHDSLLFKDKQEHHNAIMMLNKKFGRESPLPDDILKQLNLLDFPSKFSTSLSLYMVPIQSESHWLLLETTWFSLMKSFNVGQQSEHWFMDSMAEYPTIFVDPAMINESFMKCCMAIFPLIESVSVLNSRYVSLVSDVTIFLIRLFEFEMSIGNNKYCPHRLIGLLRNPSIQLLMFVGYRLTNRGGHTQQQSITIDHFINRYVVNCNGAIDNYTQEELTHNLFDSQSIAYAGFHELVQSFVTYLKESVITERLMRIPHLHHDIKLHLFDFSQRHYHNNYHQLQGLSAARRLSLSWHPQQQPLWMNQQQSSQSRSMSIDSSMNDQRPSIASVCMSSSSSMDPSTFGDPNIVLPRLNISPVRGSVTDTAKSPQQHLSHYLHGPAESMVRRRSASVGKPTFTSPNYSHMGNVILNNRPNVETSPRTVASTSVKLPPPSELFGVSSK